jgi:hypothetical protein
MESFVRQPYSQNNIPEENMNFETDNEMMGGGAAETFPR